MNLPTYAVIAMALCWLSISHAQGRGNIWYFGENAGLDFNNGAPVPLLDGQLKTFEGCATISSSDGQLLFYTDGFTVYDSSHNIMPNGRGLKGDASSTHSAIIVPRPGTCEQYYVFTADGVDLSRDNNLGEDGLHYSLVDMSLNGGKGDVSIKNTPLEVDLSEKLVAVKIQNEDAYWVITAQGDPVKLLAYKVTKDGVNPNPVETPLNRAMEHFATGQIKVSPDGKKIALGGRSLIVMDFDENTGRATNTITLFFEKNTYGIEFSPNSNILYATHSNEYSQFNLMAGGETEIFDSRFVLGGTDNGSLQRGPDGKIYGVNRSKTSLNVILNPNVMGVGCDLRLEYLDLDGRKSWLGLPTFISISHPPFFS